MAFQLDETNSQLHLRKQAILVVNRVVEGLGIRVYLGVGTNIYQMRMTRNASLMTSRHCL
jgi:hypothetical protein